VIKREGKRLNVEGTKVDKNKREGKQRGEKEGGEREKKVMGGNEREVH
jgi:hypothetical protein